jgi:hypothetical protein
MPTVSRGRRRLRIYPKPSTATPIPALPKLILASLFPTTGSRAHLMTPVEALARCTEPAILACSPSFDVVPDSTAFLLPD